jgi:predicted nucleotidyltransferase
MLEKLFTSKTRIKLLELLLFNPQKEFHIRQISRMIGISAPYIAKELKNLKEINLIIEFRKGNLKLFKINKKAPIFEEIKRIFLKTESFGEILIKNLKNLDVKYALIYGSFASGKESEKSDIDLLIIGEVNEEKILEVIRSLELKTGREVNYILWNSKEFEEKIREKHHLLIDIIKKPFIMLIGDKNEFRKIVKR